ncbi:MAG: DUF2157 domain-containing protein [Gammaproteobacteria bacterium]|nr:DUF2157 domain-containing protein [Gammaproteobacteria bacterium]
MSERVEREAALAEIGRIAEANNLTSADILAAVEGKPARAEPGGGVLARVMGYIGGIFLFAGVATFIAVNWDSFGSFARVLVTLGVGFSVFIAAVLVERDGRWPLMAAPGYLTADVLQPTGMLVAFDEYGSGGDWRIAVAITSLAIMAQALAALTVAGSAVLVFAAVFFGMSLAVTLFDIAQIDETLYVLVTGTSLVLVALGIDVDRYRWNVGAWASAGSIMFFVALFDLVEGNALEFLFPLLTAIGVYVSVQTRTRAILAISVLAFLLYISYFTAEHFSDSLGWPLVLMLIGVVFVGVGYLALRFNRRYFQGLA